MKTYQIKRVEPSIIPIGSKAGRPCVMLHFDRGGRSMTAGQVLEAVLEVSENIKEVLFMGNMVEDKDEVDYNLLFSLSSHNFVCNLMSLGTEKLAMKAGLYEHIIVIALQTDIETEMINDLVVMADTGFKKDDFGHIKYENGFIQLNPNDTIPFTGAEKAAVRFPGWNYCLHMDHRYARF